MYSFEKTILNVLKSKDKNIYKFYFVGIGGVSISALAITLLQLGQKVGGSDTKKSKTTKQLKNLGAEIYYKHDEKNVLGYDFVVYSYAVRDNVEIKKAKELNIPVISRAEFLGLVLKCYKTSICIAGAHGKTTTTALIYHILNCDKLNPSLHLGGVIKGENISHKNTNSDFIVCEACEYFDAFLHFKANIAVILNIANEHLDYYKNYENIKKSFSKFAKKSDMLICNNEQKYINNSKHTIYFGNGGNYTAKNITMLGDGTYKFDCYKYKKYYGRFHINLKGRHNVYNALASIVVADSIGIKKDIIKDALNTFCGVKRRFDVLSLKPYIISDYAHHPDEINSVLLELKKTYKNKLLVVFQPHTYSRTKLLLNEFTKALNDYEVAIYKTYSARENYQKDGSGITLCKKLNCGTYFNTKKELSGYVLSKINDDYGVIFLGAGNIDDIARSIVKKINNI